MGSNPGIDRPIKNQIPTDLYKIEMTQKIKVCGALASTVTLQWGAQL